MTHEELLAYNWDDGLAAIWPLVDSPDTELATALLIYWRNGGPFLVIDAVDGFTRMNTTVRARILDGFYRRGTLAYDPIADNQLSRTQVYKLERAGVPAVLLAAVEGAAED